MARRPAAGGGRWLAVDPTRLARWLAGFAERHGAFSVTPAPALAGVLRLLAPDGAEADLHPPPGAPVVPAGPTAADSMLDEFVVRAGATRRLGLLLARQSSVAVGIADGDRLVSSKVDSSYVQGRTAAGGWSQQRFARRRVNQARAAATVAADIAARVLLPVLPELAALVTGGDRRAVDAVLADARLAGLAALRGDRFLDVGEPRLSVLTGAVAQARAVQIRIREPD